MAGVPRDWGRNRLRFLWHGLLVLALTALTQLGGIAWLAALRFRRRLLAFMVFYTLLWGLAVVVAPLWGRQMIGCWPGSLIETRATLCALNRSYGTPVLASVLEDLAQARAAEGDRIVLLDAGFPFLDGFPLLPHLSHDDGEKADLALAYADTAGTALPGATRAPLGYFAFEPGPSDCPPRRLTMRWDLDWLQPLWRDLVLDAPRSAAQVAWLLDDPRVGKVFLEPHLQERLGLADPKLRFQGCRAARHDDHIHFQL